MEINKEKLNNLEDFREKESIYKEIRISMVL